MSTRQTLLGTCLLLVACFLGACGSSKDAKPAAEDSVAAKIQAESGPLTIEDLSSASYAGVYEHSVTLVGGRWEGEPFVPEGASRPTLILAADFMKTGDLDGDGSAEAVVLLAENSGGSGSRVYLAALSRREGQVENVGTILLGDRAQVRSLDIIEGQIRSDLILQGPTDAACCPTQKVHRVWALAATGLKEVETEVTGTLSIADLVGSEWILISFDRMEAAPAEPSIRLLFTESGVSGNGGCNDFAGGLVEESPGELSIGDLLSTRMYCSEEIMDMETRFLSALGGATGYRFVAEQLVLVYKAGETVKALAFRPFHP